LQSATGAGGDDASGDEEDRGYQTKDEL